MQPLEELEIIPTTEEQVILHDEDKHGIKQVTVKAIQTESKTVTKNGTVLPEAGKFLSSVEVSVPVGSFPTGERYIDENGSFDVTNVAGAIVNVQPDEDVTVIPTTEEQVIDRDPTKKGIKQVTVKAIQTEGLNINGENVTFDEAKNGFIGEYVPGAGRFYDGASLDIPLPKDYLKPVGDFPLSKNNTTYDVHKYATASVNLPLEDKTVTPGEAEQTVVAGEGFEALGQVKVGKIEIYEPEEITTPEATVTAPEGTYIKEVKVKVPTVAVYSGTAEPDASFGNDGDIYLLLEE
ncbi:MAG: hypothetical protein J6D20_02605 [Clostridia bacterium]|nr:hypothetical protein [Clostridia bacterium]